MVNRPTLYKCRSCNRTGRKPYDSEGNVSCDHCDSPMDALETRYKCLRCGHIEWIEVGAVGKSCHKCGYRIFVKPRKEGSVSGYKILKAR
jgi:DNA-directed RNA polymerase subunit RPC12/RpoP